MTAIHYLKTEDQYLEAIADGEKTFEVRLNDRDFNVGDFLVLCPIRAAKLVPAPRHVVCQISYGLHGGQFGIEGGYVVLGIKNVTTCRGLPEVRHPKLDGSTQ